MHMKIRIPAYWILHTAWWLLYVMVLFGFQPWSEVMRENFPDASHFGGVARIFFTGSLFSAAAVALFKYTSLRKLLFVEQVIVAGFIPVIFMFLSHTSVGETVFGQWFFPGIRELIAMAGGYGIIGSVVLFALYQLAKTRKQILTYEWCQLGGWSTFIFVYSFVYLTISTKQHDHFFNTLFLDAWIGLAVTHIMRLFIIQTGLLKLNVQKQIIFIITSTFLFALVFAFISASLEYTFEWESAGAGPKFHIKVLANLLACFLFLTIWNLIYLVYHFVMKSREEQLDRIKLQSTVKELELKTIKAHINPHFIFNALNSIRALVDENPGRARTAITELSNILRSSMQAEKAETTPLEKELNIVKDYLALEHIRFEDRLRVEYEIDEDTLDQPVPPMMLQTLVENAIKHGISKHVDGGSIKIISDFRNNHHELIVQNTGKLNGTYNYDGFGLTSTQNRLKLLYGPKASFQIMDKNGNMVEARVLMPVENT
ncbi:MAG: sensor histidine kinase [Chitinophagaceae bacterium]|jgi:signal transduction histidine kinase|nr:sensor histidine kinase [Chitinophagaceae bacterium]